MNAGEHAWENPAGNRYAGSGKKKEQRQGNRAWLAGANSGTTQRPKTTIKPATRQ